MLHLTRTWTLVCGLLLVGGVSYLAGQGAPPVSNAQAVDAYVSGRIAAGEMNQAEAEEAIGRAYSGRAIDKAEFDKLTEKIRREFEQAKKDKNDQNPVFRADWPWGSVFPGYDYKTGLDVANGCTAGQTVSITYPPNMFMTGPATISVPGKRTETLPITLELSKVQLPPLPALPIQLPVCPVLTGNLIAEHPRVGRCLAMRREYTVSMQLHLHPPPGGGGTGGGGGGGGGRGRGRGGQLKKLETCDTYWTRGEFFPTKDAPTPEACLEDFRSRMGDYIGDEVEPRKKAEPWMFATAPPKDDVQRMTMAELIRLRHQFDLEVLPKTKR